MTPSPKKIFCRLKPTVRPRSRSSPTRIQARIPTPLAPTTSSSQRTPSSPTTTTRQKWDPAISEIGIIKTPSLFFKDWDCIAQMIGDQI